MLDKDITFDEIKTLERKLYWTINEQKEAVDELKIIMSNIECISNEVKPCVIKVLDDFNDYVKNKLWLKNTIWKI